MYGTLCPQQHRMQGSRAASRTVIRSAAHDSTQCMPSKMCTHACPSKVYHFARHKCFLHMDSMPFSSAVTWVKPILCTIHVPANEDCSCPMLLLLLPYVYANALQGSIHKSWEAKPKASLCLWQLSRQPFSKAQAACLQQSVGCCLTGRLCAETGRDIVR